MSSLYGKATETGMLMKILSATVAFGNIQKLYCSNGDDLFTSVDSYITTLLIHVPNLWHLTLRLLMSYIYGAPSKARNANVYIWTYVWQR